MGMLGSFFRGVDDLFGGDVQRVRQQRQQNNQLMELRQLQEERAAREELRRQADQSLRFVDAQSKMNEIARPVGPNGTVEYSLNTPDQLSGVSGYLPDVVRQRQAGPNIATILDPRGKEKQFELMSPDELDKRGMRVKRDSILSEIMAKEAGAKQARDTYGQDMQIGGRTIRMMPDDIGKNAKLFDEMGRRRIVPGFEKYGPISADEFGGTASLDDNTNVNYRPFVNYATGDVTFGGINPKTGEPSVVKPPALAGAAAPRPRVPAKTGGTGSKRGDSLTAYQRMMKERYDREHAEKQSKAAQGEVDALQKQEQALHQKKTALGAKWDSMDKKGRDKAKGELAAADAQIEQLQKRQKELIARHQGGGTGAAPAPAPSKGGVVKLTRDANGRIILPGR